MQQCQLAALIEAAAAKETVFTAFEDGQDVLSQTAEPTVDNVVSTVSQNPVEVRSNLNRLVREWMMMKLPILPCAEKLELVLSTAPRT